MSYQVKDILSLNDLQELQSSSKKFILFFWAEWHDLSKRNTGQLQEIYQTLANKYNTSIEFYLVEAENVIDVSEKYEVSVVPTFITFFGSKVVGKLEGANPAELNKLVKTLTDTLISVGVTTSTNTLSPPPPSTSTITTQTLNDRLKKLIHMAPVMVFIKGTPSVPRCGFSRQIVEILQKNSIEFGSFDILSDEEVRQELKTYSDWPTYPQLYVNGKLIGGLDIVKELEASGDLKKELGIQEIILSSTSTESVATTSLHNRLKTLIHQAPVMLFMKGTPEAPRCGFSRTISNILKEENIEFQSFDILSDEEIRQGLKTYSDWPTYPQLYVNGVLIGGLDILNDMKAEGNLKQQLGL